MKVCLIAEGCYPYVTGGVSSWIHQLISGLPEHKFKVISIMPSDKEKLVSHYDQPANLLEVKTIYLDNYLTLKHPVLPKNIVLSQQDVDSLFEFLKMDYNTDWLKIINLLNKSQKIGNAIELLQSEIFWEIITEYYQENYQEESFNTFFWTIRTMMLPFVHLLQQETEEADIYHAVSTGYAGILGVCLKEVTHKPFVLTEHGIYAREREEEIIKAKWVTGIYKKLWIKFFYFISVAAYKEADKIVALFNRNRDIQLELGAPPERTIVIANGVDYEEIKIVKEKHEGYIVGAILRIVPIKDVLTLIRAFRIVKNSVEQAQLWLIGPTDEDVDYYQQCVKLISLLKLEEDVTFTGRVDVKRVLPKVDVIVLTSISEGQPLVMLEGMAAEIPIVATDVGSCRELLEENEFEESCGLVTNLVSPNETAAQIIRLLENPMLQQKMGKNGRARVERAYNKELFLSSYRQIYDSLG